MEPWGRDHCGGSANRQETRLHARIRAGGWKKSPNDGHITRDRSDGIADRVLIDRWKHMPGAESGVQPSPAAHQSGSCCGGSAAERVPPTPTAWCWLRWTVGRTEGKRLFHTTFQAVHCLDKHVRANARCSCCPIHLACSKTVCTPLQSVPGMMARYSWRRHSCTTATTNQ